MTTIVVGSGCTGAMAAQTLAEADEPVLLLDGGTDPASQPDVPPGDYLSLRRSDSEQYRFLLGQHLDAAVGTSSVGPQLTPPRAFVTEHVDTYLPVSATGFRPLESLATGGLGNAWGLGCCVYRDDELQRLGTPVPAMRESYQTVADRIGISGEDDDARGFTHADLTGVMAAPAVDPVIEDLFARYRRQRGRFQERGVALGRPSLALLTEPKDQRGAFVRRELEFYADPEGASYRPSLTVEMLRRRHRCQHHRGVLVTSFADTGAGVEVEALDIRSGSRMTFRGERLVLAAGALGTARIVMRSLGIESCPYLCNPYSYYPCIAPKWLGRPVDRPGLGLAQAAMFATPASAPNGPSMASIYTYRQLMDFRLAREMPFDLRTAAAVTRFLVPGLVILGIHHPDAGDPTRKLWLEASATSPAGDALAASAPDTTPPGERQAEGLMLWAAGRLGLWPLRRVAPPFGASIHYAGTVPFSDSGAPGTLAANGRLAGTRRVFVADGSGFQFLPAQSLTLSLMANADRVARAFLETPC